MRPQRVARASLLLALTLGLAGCSATSASKVASKNPARSLAVVGDRPLPATVGEPGDQVAAEVVEPEPKRNPLARISGRVIDERGRPVPDATVRLADGGQQGGRDSRTTTDRSGAFTLGGLRPGSDYVIVAEAETEGATQTGRARARTADTGVAINLGPDDDSTAARRPSTRSPRTRPISSREPIDDPAEQKTISRVNREDLDPSQADPSAEERPRGRTATSGTAQLAAPFSIPGWRKGGSSAKPPARGEAGGDPPLDLPPDPPTTPRRAATGDLPPDDDGPNPLPPAIEPSEREERPTSPGRSREETVGRSSSRPDTTQGEPGALSFAEEPIPTRQGKSRDGSPGPGMVPMPTLVAEDRSRGTTSDFVTDDLPASLEPDPAAGSRRPGLDLADTQPARPAPEAPPGPRALAREESRKNPAAGPVFASPGPADLDPNAAYDPFALVAVSVASAPEIKPPSLAPVEPVEPVAVAVADSALTPASKKWGDLADRDRPKLVVEPTKASSSLLRRIRGAGPTAPKASPVMLCDYDSRHRRVANFQLPDLEGKPVRLHDLDAEYVLLDFWGTWCKPCLDSIPHLVELQKKYGPTKLRVVGIACEQEAQAEKAARVAEFTRRLGINYTVLLSTMDGTCPLQNALQVQFYPTMVLLDRGGQILWRDRGATESTLARLDKVLESRSTATMARR